MDEALPTQSSSASQNMDTADENGNGIDNNESQGIIPWKWVPPDVRHELIKRLNPPAPLSGNDWRMLACKLGNTAAEINFIESEKDNNTQVLFRHYDVKPGASFNDVYKFLTEMQRRDCVDILDAAYAKIRQAYIQAQSSQRFNTVGIPDPRMTGGHNQQPNHSCPCTHAGHLTPAYGSHSWCPCGNSYTVCGCVGNSHLHSHPTHLSLLPRPYQLGISQAVCTSGHTSPSPTYTVHNSVSKNPQTHLGPSGYAHGEGNCASTLSFPPGSFHQRLPNAHTSIPESQADSSNLNVTGDGTVINMLISRETNRQKVSRQHYEDRNLMPDWNRDKRLRNNCSSNGFGTNHRIGIHAVADPAGGRIQHRDVPNSVDHLNSPVNYMDHMGRPLFAGPEKVAFLTDNSDGPTGMNSCHSNMRRSWDRGHLPATFPLMRKTKHDGTTDDSRNLTVPKKSVSLPADTDRKPMSLRKVLKSSRVFVTYSYDSELHAKQVLSLCQFLEANGFLCFVDVSEDDNSSSECSRVLESCRQRIAEVDFILVCISNKYLEDIARDTSDCLSSSSRRRQLHTRQIYELLNSNHLYGVNNNTSGTARSPRVIPLLFAEVPLNLIPRCLMSGPTYKWPKQHMNLARLLRKPEEWKRMTMDTMED